MDSEIQEYLESLTRLLSGQLRGAINMVARKENEDLIFMTLHDVFEKAEERGKALMAEEITLTNLKRELKDDNTD